MAVASLETLVIRIAVGHAARPATKALGKDTRIYEYIKKKCKDKLSLFTK